MEEQMLKKVKGTTELAKRLSECPEITRYDAGEHKEAWALADGFSDLEEAFRAFLDVHLPKLTDSSLNCEEVVDVLQNIGEEFRTILWHIKAPQFYSYLQDETQTGKPHKGK